MRSDSYLMGTLGRNLNKGLQGSELALPASGTVGLSFLSSILPALKGELQC